MRILVAEDERDLNRLICRTLERAGYSVDACFDGEAALDCLLGAEYDCLLLDIMMPKKDGHEVLRTVRAKGDTTPVIFLTALDDEFSVVTGLDMGADDYISKPFRPRELVSRMRSVLRRTGRTQSVVSIRDIRIDTEKGTVSREGEEIFLSALEYRLLLVFVNHKGMILTRSMLLDEIWDAAGDFVNDNTLTVYIKKKKKKIEKDPQNPEIILTVRGMGYRLGE